MLQDERGEARDLKRITDRLGLGIRNAEEDQGRAVGVALEDFQDLGRIHVRSEIWTARTTIPVRNGQRVWQEVPNLLDRSAVLLDRLEDLRRHQLAFQIGDH